MTLPPPPTAAELKRICDRDGLRPNRGLGQNFMVSRSALDALAEAAELSAQDVVLEPGPGPGGLTTLLAQGAGRVIAVELDAGLYRVAAGRLAGAGNVRLLHADILGPDGALHPDVREELRTALAGRRARFKLVSNLPYSVSTAVIGAVLTGEPMPERLVVTVQKEVADRLTATPGGRDYGYLTVLVQAVAEVKTLKRLPPSAFWPQPEVESTIVRISPRSENERPGTAELARLQRLCSGIFTHRRKQISRALVMSGLAASRDEAEMHLAAVGVEPKRRPESVEVIDLLRLAHRLS